MESFDLKKFLIENKLTTNSKQLEEINWKGVAAGAAMLGAVGAHGQIKPEYKAKIDSIQRTTDLTPQQKRAEIQKIVQLNRNQIIGKKREEFLRTMAAAGFTDEEQYRKYLEKLDKRADVGLDGMQGPEFKSTDCGISKQHAKDDKKDWKSK